MPPIYKIRVDRNVKKIQFVAILFAPQLHWSSNSTCYQDVIVMIGKGLSGKARLNVEEAFIERMRPMSFPMPGFAGRLAEVHGNRTLFEIYNHSIFL